MMAQKMPLEEVTRINLTSSPRKYNKSPLKVEFNNAKCIIISVTYVLKQ